MKAEVSLKIDQEQLELRKAICQNLVKIRLGMVLTVVENYTHCLLLCVMKRGLSL